MRVLVITAAVVAGASSTCEQTIVASVAKSIEAVPARQALLPPPKNDSERLERMGELDQAPRDVIMNFDFSKVPESERSKQIAQASALIAAVDAENQSKLGTMLPKEGWFLRSRYSEKAALAAFLIVQHGSVQLQERILPIIAPLARSGEVEGQSYGMMVDRVAVANGQPQTYGTQFRCDGGKWRPYPIVDPSHLEARRGELAFPVSYAEMKAHFDSLPPCPQTRSPPPPGMKLD